MADAQVQANDEQEIAEAQNSLVDLLYDVVAQAATTRIGGFFYRRIDSVLSTVEKTAKWSLPQPDPTAAAAADGEDAPDADNKISAPPLVRPLPWLLFLPALVAMRLVRVGLSLVALLIGQPPVTPSTVVYYVQNKRRKLRALKYRGQKLYRISRAEARAEEELQTTWLSRITMPLRMIIWKPGRVVIAPHRHHHRHPSSRQQNQNQQQQQTPGRKRNVHERDEDGDSPDEIDEATVNELLDKYADDAGDSSYHVDSSGDSTDSSLSEQEKSAIEGKERQPEATKKESNGHGPKEGQASQARRKSDLNAVESDQPKSSSSSSSKPISEEKSKPAENGSVDGGSKKQDTATAEQAKTEAERKETEKANDGTSKSAENGSVDGAKEERAKTESSKPKSDSERTDGKQPSAAGQQQKNSSEDDASKAQTMSEVKTNSQQKIKQQQQPNQNQPQHANANGGSGGKKQKRPSQSHQ